jgi:energy-coupling factor transport system permease protein
VLDYSPGESLVHKMDVRAKVLLFVAFTVVLFLFSNPAINLALAVLATLLLLYVRMPFGRLWRLIKPVAPVFVIIAIISGFTYSGFRTDLANTVIFYALPGERLPFTYGGLFFGLTLMLRIYCMVVVTSVLTFTTPLDDFVQLMRAMRFPQPLTFIVVTGLRFVPTMQKKVDQVFDAQRARGARFSGGGPFRQVTAYVPVMVPLIVESLRMSENLAIAMLNRGYGASKEWTPLRELRMTTLDVLALLIGLAALAAAVFLRTSGYGVL